MAPPESYTRGNLASIQTTTTQSRKTKCLGTADRKTASRTATPVGGSKRLGALFPIGRTGAFRLRGGFCEMEGIDPRRPADTAGIASGRVSITGVELHAHTDARQQNRRSIVVDSESTE